MLMLDECRKNNESTKALFKYSDQVINNYKLNKIRKKPTDNASEEVHINSKVIGKNSKEKYMNW